MTQSSEGNILQWGNNIFRMKQAELMFSGTEVKSSHIVVHSAGPFTGRS